jgi:hypothetical protein
LTATITMNGKLVRDLVDTLASTKHQFRYNKKTETSALEYEFWS